MAALLAWLPDAQTVRTDLSYVPPAGIDETFLASSWKGMPMRWHAVGRLDAPGGTGFFSASHWTRFTAQHWEVPLLAVAVYLVAIPSLQRLVARRGRFDVKDFAFWWNAGLSLFSWCGVAACVPVLLGSLAEHGLYFTTCAPAAWYGGGINGLFVMLFVYSKLPELVDTVLLALGGKPVIALQWWHHTTVLLYSWHSYSTRIATGAWFACMNYSVHSIMYGYFAVTATKHRRLVVPYAMYITLLQLLQMLVGIFVTVKAVLYQAAGEECHVNRTNSVLGLLMYASYFVLFFKLFVDNYFVKGKGARPPQKQPSLRDAARAISRQVTGLREAGWDGEGAAAGEKKAN
jgi:elongation of very long chain fatty acids protein 6